MTALRFTFTAFIVTMIVLPIPPSTIIGVILATNPKTGKYMDQRVYKATMLVMSKLGQAFMMPVLILADRRMESAKIRIETGNVRL